MNHIQCLEDEQLQDVIGGGHNEGESFGLFTSGVAISSPGLSENIVLLKAEAGMVSVTLGQFIAEELLLTTH